MNWQDRNTCVLFGDNAGAAVVGQVEDGYGVLSIDMGADDSWRTIFIAASREDPVNRLLMKQLTLVSILFIWMAAKFFSRVCC